MDSRPDNHHIDIFVFFGETGQGKREKLCLLPGPPGRAIRDPDGTVRGGAAALSEKRPQSPTPTSSQWAWITISFSSASCLRIVAISIWICAFSSRISYI